MDEQKQQVPEEMSGVVGRTFVEAWEKLEVAISSQTPRETGITERQATALLTLAQATAAVYGQRNKFPTREEQLAMKKARNTSAESK